MPEDSLFTAPGKLVVAGEYAVLEGHRALSCAVSKYVRVRVRPNSDQILQNHSGVIRSVMQEFDIRRIALPPLILEVDSSELYFSIDNSRTKLGLGSSAAVAVAVTKALLAHTNRNDDSDLAFNIAQSAHYHFSKNTGSGIDVATSFHQGLIVFQIDGHRKIIVHPIFDSPLCSKMIAVFTGQRQSTAPFLKRVEHAKHKHASKYRTVISGIAAATAGIIDAFTGIESSHSFEKLCFGVKEHNSAMEQLEQLARIKIFTEPHNTIENLATKYGGVAKPSGAGGDVTLCFLPSSAQGHFKSDVESNGLFVLDLNFCVLE